MATKRGRVIELRDIALPTVKARGAWQNIEPGSLNLLVFSHNDLRIAFRSPFQKLPPPNGELVRKVVAYDVRLPPSLPYGLYVWAPTKVLNIEWSDDGVFDVVNYKAGAWESQLEDIAAQ